MSGTANALVEAAFLYVIGESRGPHKVGLSAVPQRRLSQLQTGTARKLMLKRTSAERYVNAAKIERYAHWLLRESAIRGEWFRVTEEAAWVALTAAAEAVARGLDVPAGERVGGRKPLPDVMTVRFAEGTFERVDAAAGKNRRAKFVREAVEEKLAKPKRATPRKPTDP